MPKTTVRAALLLAPVLLLLPSKKIFSSPSSPSSSSAPVGLWHAALLPTPEYPVLFDVRIASKGRGKGLAAFLVNGAVEVPCASAAWDGTTLTLELAHDDARIVAARKGDGLEGRYVRAAASGGPELPFAASRRAPAVPAAPADGRTLAGSWGFDVGEPPAPVEKWAGVLEQKGAALRGSFLSASGDRIALHGWFDGERLLLTVFDGARIVRLDGELLPDGTLAGDCRSRTNPPVTWRARRP